MRILWVREGRLLPIDSGGKIRSAHTLRELAKRHEVHVLSSYLARSRDESYEAALRAEFPGAQAVYFGRGLPWYGWRGTLQLLSPTPHAIRQARSPGVAHAIAGHLGSGHFDVAVCDFLETAANFPRDLPVPVVLFEHNVEWLRRKAEGASERRWPSRLALAIEARRLRSFEAATIRRFAHTIAMSEEDAAHLRALAPQAAITPVPTGVDTEAYRPRPRPPGVPPLVVFAGLMSYPPNVDAATWFCRESWPSIRTAVPDARFRIVGGFPPAAVRALASDSIEVTGYVASVAGHLAAASVVVVPLRHGSGTRLKMYEAMASGRAVVSTTIGAEGLDVHAGEDIIIADEAAAIAREVTSLLLHPDRAQALGQAAVETAAKHSWPNAVLPLERVLEGVVRGDER